MVLQLSTGLINFSTIIIKKYCKRSMTFWFTNATTREKILFLWVVLTSLYDALISVFWCALDQISPDEQLPMDPKCILEFFFLIYHRESVQPKRGQHIVSRMFKEVSENVWNFFKIIRHCFEGVTNL